MPPEGTASQSLASRLSGARDSHTETSTNIKVGIGIIHTSLTPACDSESPVAGPCFFRQFQEETSTMRAPSPLFRPPICGLSLVLGLLLRAPLCSGLSASVRMLITFLLNSLSHNSPSLLMLSPGPVCPQVPPCRANFSGRGSC